MKKLFWAGIIGLLCLAPLGALSGCACPEDILEVWEGSATFIGSGSIDQFGLKITFGSSKVIVELELPWGCLYTLPVDYTHEDCVVNVDGSFQMSEDCWGYRDVQGKLEGKLRFTSEDRLSGRLRHAAHFYDPEEGEFADDSGTFFLSATRVVD